MTAEQFKQLGYTLLSAPSVDGVLIGVRETDRAVVITDSDGDMIILTKAQIFDLFKFASEAL